MSVPQWLPIDVKEHLKSGKPLQIIDVREPSEFRYGHIPQAKLLPLGELGQRYQEIDPGVDAVIVCASGNRSGMATQALVQAGYTKVRNLMGGMSMWDGDVER